MPVGSSHLGGPGEGVRLEKTHVQIRILPGPQIFTEQPVAFEQGTVIRGPVGSAPANDGVGLAGPVHEQVCSLCNVGVGVCVGHRSADTGGTLPVALQPARHPAGLGDTVGSQERHITRLGRLYPEVPGAPRKSRLLLLDHRNFAQPGFLECLRCSPASGVYHHQLVGRGLLLEK